MWLRRTCSEHLTCAASTGRASAGPTSIPLPVLGGNTPVAADLGKLLHLGFEITVIIAYHIPRWLASGARILISNT